MDDQLTGHSRSFAFLALSAAKSAAAAAPGLPGVACQELPATPGMLMARSRRCPRSSGSPQSPAAV